MRVDWIINSDQWEVSSLGTGIGSTSLSTMTIWVVTSNWHLACLWFCGCPTTGTPSYIQGRHLSQQMRRRVRLPQALHDGVGPSPKPTHSLPYLRRIRNGRRGLGQPLTLVGTKYNIVHSDGGALSPQ